MFDSCICLPTFQRSLFFPPGRISSFEKSMGLHFYQTTRRHIPQDRKPLLIITGIKLKAEENIYKTVLLFYIVQKCYHNTSFILSSDLLPSFLSPKISVASVAPLLQVCWSVMLCLLTLGMKEIGVMMAYLQHNVHSEVHEIR
jgi:hypothetical protein